MQNMGPPLPLPAPAPKRFYTVQRVNGNGGNGKGDGVAGPHKHTLEDSDRVKKNSVTRWMAKNEKDNKKKVQVSRLLLSYLVRWTCNKSLGVHPFTCWRSTRTSFEFSGDRHCLKQLAVASCSET
jgi:hypothetical protein